jgi:hypothetical protein
MTAKSEKAGDTALAKNKRTFSLAWLNAGNALWFIAGGVVGFIGHVLMTSAGVDDSDDSDIE